MSDTPAIKVDGVNKTFRLPHEKTSSIKGAIINFYKLNRNYEKQHVLKDVSFEIKEGEFFGIVGRNGSGKSTLLKLLAGIYAPDKGAIQINGKLTPFIELGVGFNPELTGRENVFLNGALLGFTRKETESMYDEIVSFAEIERFMDQKLKNYSSGMQVRLAFSIAIRAKTDILLIDEVLAVGDSAFQKKCYEVFSNLKKQGKTIVFVTHDMSAVERFCDRCLVINKGVIQGVMTPRDASGYYDELNAKQSAASDTKERKKDAPRQWGSGEVRLASINMYSKGHKLTDGMVQMGEDLEIKMEFTAKDKKNIVVGLGFEDAFGVNISGPNSRQLAASSDQAVSYKVNQLSLLPGDYKLTVAIFDEAVVNEYDHHDRAFTLRVQSKDHNLFGKVNLFGSWESSK